jgi:hypothetical protein
MTEPIIAFRNFENALKNCFAEDPDWVKERQTGRTEDKHENKR